MYVYVHNHYMYTAQEASWNRGFDPVNTLLFDLYH